MHESEIAEKEPDTTSGVLEGIQYRKAIIEHNQLHDPLHNIPPEIVSAIFRFAGKQDPVDHFLNPDTPTLLKRSLRRCQWPLDVSSVCARWRSIAVGDPRLWTTISMYRCGESWTLPLELVEQRVSRCGALPFHVALWWETGTQTVDTNFNSLVKFLCARCARWSNLLLRVPSHIVQLFKHNNNAKVTLNLNLVHIDATGDPDLRHFWNMEDAVIRPRRATFTGLVTVPKSISWSNLTTVSFRCINVCDLLSVISQCKDIKSLDITLLTTRPFHLNRPIPVEPIALARLAQLSIMFSNQFDLDFFVAFTRFPALRFFVLFYVGDVEQHLGLRTLQKVLAQCKGLRSLYFQNVSFVPHELPALLSRFPRLRVLRFVNRNRSTTTEAWLDALFNCLTATLSNSPLTNFLPGLISFDYIGPTAFSWSTVADLLEAHIKIQLCPDRPPPHRLLMHFNIGIAFSTTQEQFKYIDKDVLLQFLGLPPHWMDISIEEKLVFASLEHHGIDRPPHPMFEPCQNLEELLGSEHLFASYPFFIGRKHMHSSITQGQANFLLKRMIQGRDSDRVIGDDFYRQLYSNG